MPTDGKTERQITDDLFAYVRTRDDVWMWKYHGNSFSRAGFPDLEGHVNGRFFGIEVKLPGLKKTGLTLCQKAWIQRLNKQGAKATVVTSVDEFKAFIAENFPND